MPKKRSNAAAQLIRFDDVKYVSLVSGARLASTHDPEQRGAFRSSGL